MKIYATNLGDKRNQHLTTIIWTSVLGKFIPKFHINTILTTYLYIMEGLQTDDLKKVTGDGLMRTAKDRDSRRSMGETVVLRVVVDGDWLVWKYYTLPYLKIKEKIFESNPIPIRHVSVAYQSDQILLAQ